MPRAKKARRAKPQKRAPAPAAPPAEENGNAAAGAMLALEDGRGGVAEAEGSVEDPLEDWPEAGGEPDRWLDERPGEDVQKPPDE